MNLAQPMEQIAATALAVLKTDPTWWRIPSLKGRTAIVTGGAGFLGAHLVRLLTECHAQVVAADVAQEPQRIKDLFGRVRYVAADLTDSKATRRLFKECRPDYVFHLAAYAVQASQRNWSDAIRINVNGSLSVVDACAGLPIQRFLQVGTAHEYGGSDAPLAVDSPLQPSGVYGATKAASMVIGRTRAQELGVPWSGVRPFVAFGPQESEEKLVPYVIVRALRGEPIETTSAEQVRDFVYVKDLVAGIVHAALASTSRGETINLASGEARPLARMIRQAAALVAGADLRLGARPHRGDYVEKEIADLTKTRLLLPDWTPHYTVSSGLEETLQWYHRCLGADTLARRATRIDEHAPENGDDGPLPRQERNGPGPAQPVLCTPCPEASDGGGERP